MRARMAISSAQQSVELREIVLRDKPEEMIAVSAKGTVPVLILDEQSVVDESLDIMLWALEENDPENWLSPDQGTKAEMLALIEKIDGEFKASLDAYKYAPRNVPADSPIALEANQHRDKALAVLIVELESRLETWPYLFGDRASLADFAIAPFVRQFANTDIAWFEAQPRDKLKAWLNTFLASETFGSVMTKYEPWKTSGQSVQFP